MDIATLGLEVRPEKIDRANRSLDRFSDVARKAEGSAKSMGTGATGAARRMIAANDNIARSANRMAGVYRRAGRIITAALVSAFTAVSLRKFVSATVEANQVQAQLGAAIASTGGAAARSIAQLNAHAAALQRITNFGDEATNAAQGVLLTFTRIRGDQFDKATEAVQDLATAMRMDLKSAAIQVGKALNDPVVGMTALQRSGITFTESQKSMVAQLAASGDMIGAQTLILKELETQFGGSAKAARNELGGALTSLRNAWGDLFELGREKSEVLRLAIERLIKAISDPAFVNLVQTIGVHLVEAFASVIEKVADLASSYPNLNWLIKSSSAIATQAAGAFRMVAAELSGLGQAISLIGEGEFRKARDAWNAGQSEFLRIQAETKRAVDAIWAEPGPGAAIGTNKGDIGAPFKAATPAVEELGGAIQQVNTSLADMFVGGGSGAAAVIDSMDALRSGARGFLGDFVGGLRQGESAVNSLLSAVKSLGDRLIDMGLNSITTPVVGQQGTMDFKEQAT